jgi:hypothetical protein
MSLHAIANGIDHGDLPASNLGLLLEHFRGAPFEATLADAAGRIAAEDIDEGEEEAVFLDVLERLRTAALKADIAELNARARSGGLTPEEEARRARLLAATVKPQAR